MANSFKLGDWRAEPDLNRLVGSDGEEVKVEPKTMDVLVYLVRRQGEVVSSAEIVEAVWAGYPMSDNPVYKTIGRLRSALGDDPKMPKYIQTISTRGYRIIAPISEFGSTTSELSGAPDAGATRARRVPQYVLVAAALVALATSWVYLLNNPDSDPRVHKLVSAFPGSHSEPSFSPDGKRIAFTSDESGQEQVWVLDLDTLQRQQVTHTETSSSRPRWSPVAGQILFQSQRSLWLISTDGGGARQVIRSGYYPDWSPDGSQFVFERAGEIWTANANGSNQNRVEGLPASDLPLAARRPSYSPDGALIAFFHAPISPFGDWWIVATNGGSPRQLTFDKARGGWATWTSDSQFLVISSQRAGSKTLWKIPIRGGAPQPVLTGAGDYDGATIADDKLVYASRQDRYTLCVSDPATGHTKEVFSSPNDMVMPRYSPDGTEIAFFAILQDGDTQVLAVPKEGGQERHVTTDVGARNAAHNWSADGNSMYFYRMEPAPAFMKNDANGGPAEIVVDGWNWIKENDAQVHPHKPKIIYSRIDRGRAVSTMIHDLTDGTDSLFATTLRQPKWSHSGEMIVGIKPSQSILELVVCDEYGSGCRSLGEGGWEPIWSKDDSRVYFKRPISDGYSVMSVSIDSGTVAEHTDIRPVRPIIGGLIDASASGEIAWIRYERGTAELWLTSISE